MLARKQQDAALKRPGFMTRREWGSREMERLRMRAARTRGRGAGVLCHGHKQA